jgi:adenine-specific DNA-methyltransferase
LGASPAQRENLIEAVEFNAEEAQIAKDRLMEQGFSATSEAIHTTDFFAYCREHYIEEQFLGATLSPGHHFDAIIGNPPFIRYQNFPEAHQRIAFELMQNWGFHPNRLTNAWVPFLINCSR